MRTLRVRRYRNAFWTSGKAPSELSGFFFPPQEPDEDAVEVAEEEEEEEEAEEEVEDTQPARTRILSHTFHYFCTFESHLLHLYTLHTQVLICFSASAAESQFHVPSTLTQHFTIVPARLRLLVLLGFLRAQASKAKVRHAYLSWASCLSKASVSLSSPLQGAAGIKVLLFANTTAGVDFYAVLLGSLLGSIATVSKLHGSMDMPERKVTVRNFTMTSAKPLTVRHLRAPNRIFCLSTFLYAVFCLYP